MVDRSQLPLAVIHADVAMGLAFHMSANYFHTGELDLNWRKEVTTLTRVTTPLTLPDRTLTIIEDDVLSTVTINEGTIVVLGDVRSSIVMSGYCELIIAGSVLDGATIDGDDIHHVFVGGDVLGCLRGLGSCVAWIQGHMRGHVWTGQPSTRLRVFGDCTGTIRPTEKPSLLWLEIGGFMSYESLEATAAIGYTEFNASVSKSNRPKGLYPDKTVYNALRQHRSYNCWVIHDLVNDYSHQKSEAPSD